MKNTLIKLVATLVVVAALTPGASALTQTVNSSDTAATIQAAINAVLASADPAGEVVFNTGTYVLAASLEVIMNSDGDITLRGANPANRPIIVCPNYTGGSTQDGAISIGGTGTTITVRDMIILPPAVSGQPFGNPETIGIGGRTTLANCTLNFANLLLTGNDGTNNPAGTDGLADPRTFPNGTRFENACINLVPAAANVNTLTVNGTALICSMGGAEGYYLSGGTGSRGARKATFTNCKFTWNAADGFRSTNVGDDDRYINCVFNWNGAGQAFNAENQGIHNSSRVVGDGGSSYFENCEASYNADRGFFIGTEVYGTVVNCTAINNGFFFPGIPATAATGVDFTGGSSQQNFLMNGMFCSNNGGGSVKISGNQAPTAATANCTIRNVVSLSNGNNEGITRSTSADRGGIQFGGAFTALVENCYVQNCSGVAIWHDCFATQTNMNVTIRNSSVVNSGMNGVLVWYVGNGSQVLMENVNLINTSNDPAAITSSANRGSAINMRTPGLATTGNIRLHNVIVDGAQTGTVQSGGYGFWLEVQTAGSGTVVIQDCTFSRTVKAGLAIGGGVLSVTDCLFYNHGNEGLVFHSGNPITMQNVSIINCASYGITFGNEGFSAPVTPLKIGRVDHVMVASCALGGIRVLSNQIATPLWTLDHSTLYNNPVGFLMAAANFTSQPVEIQNCIIAAAGGTGVRVTSLGSSPINVHHTGLVQAGPHALTTPTEDLANIPSTITTSNLVTADPVFAGTTFGQAPYLDVRETAYGGMGTAASNLSGWADYIGDFTGIEGWRAF